MKLSFPISLTAIVFSAVLMISTPVYSEQASYTDDGEVAAPELAKCKAISTFCVAKNGDIWVCDDKAMELKILRNDSLLKTITLDFGPQAIERHPSGGIILAGGGRIAILDNNGDVVTQGSLPGTSPRLSDEMSEAARQKIIRRAQTATGICAHGDDVFVAARSRSGYSIYRLNKDLTESKEIVSRLRGCCGQMDFTVDGNGILHVAANCNFKVLRYDRDGQEKEGFGARSRNPSEGFCGCCEPKNVCMAPDGSIITSESGSGSIKRFGADGSYLGELARIKIGGCVRVTIGVSPDGSNVYMLDGRKRRIIRLKAADAPSPLTTNSNS